MGASLEAEAGFRPRQEALVDSMGCDVTIYIYTYVSYFGHISIHTHVHIHTRMYRQYSGRLRRFEGCYKVRKAGLELI